jgi:uncharacterized protein (DUF1778 family)
LNLKNSKGAGKINMTVYEEKKRVSARIPFHAYQILTRAAEISGATLNQFLVQAAIEKAHMIIEKDKIINLSLRSANVFFDIIENPPTPNKALKKAMKVYKESFCDAEYRNSR